MVVHGSQSGPPTNLSHHNNRDNNNRDQKSQSAHAALDAQGQGLRPGPGGGSGGGPGVNHGAPIKSYASHSDKMTRPDHTDSTTHITTSPSDERDEQSSIRNPQGRNQGGNVGEKNNGADKDEVDDDLRSTLDSWLKKEKSESSRRFPYMDASGTSTVMTEEVEEEADCKRHVYEGKLIKAMM